MASCPRGTFAEVWDKMGETGPEVSNNRGQFPMGSQDTGNKVPLEGELYQRLRYLPNFETLVGQETKQLSFH